MVTAGDCALTVSFRTQLIAGHAQCEIWRPQVGDSLRRQIPINLQFTINCIERNHYVIQLHFFFFLKPADVG